MELPAIPLPAPLGLDIRGQAQGTNAAAGGPGDEAAAVWTEL